MDLKRENERLRQRIKELEATVVEQRKLKSELRQSEERLRLLFEYAPIGITRIDTTGKITDANDAFLKMLEIKRERLIGKNVFDIVNNADKALVFKKATEGVIGTWKGIINLLLAQGRHICG